MKKNAVMLLCLLLVCCVCSFAAAEGKSGDFLLMDELSWSMTVEDLKDVFQMEPEMGQLGGDFVAACFNSVSVPPIQGKVDFEFGFNQKSGQMMLCIAYIDVDKPLFSLTGEDILKETYEMLVSEGNQIYQGRSKTLFSSTDEMAALYESEEERGIYIDSFLNGLRSAIEDYQNAYDTDGWECITDADGWFIDDSIGVGIMYSGQKINDDQIRVTYINVESTLNNIGAIISAFDVNESVSLNACRFGLPAGCFWGDNGQAVREALGNAYSMTDGDTIYAAFAEDEFTGGYDADGVYLLSDDQLALVFYYIYDADQAVYDDVVAMITEDAGKPSNDEISKGALEDILEGNEGINAAEVWLREEYVVICANVYSQSMVSVMLMPWSLFSN